MIVCTSPKAGYLAHKTEIAAAMFRVLNKGQYILGQEVTLFEQEFSKYLHSKYAIGVGSGTDALYLVLRACGIGRGDEVITVSHTAVATVAAIELTGATPVFVDIEPLFFTIDPTKLEPAITSKTRAVIPVHLYGQPADLTPIIKIARKNHLLVIEDCAQAHGAIYKNRKVGTWGDVGCFSFYPTKNVGAFGDGGAVVTNNHQLALKVKKLREYGWSKKHFSLIPGINSRLDELQAAILRVKLKYLDRGNKLREQLAALYTSELADTDLLLPAKRPKSSHVYHQFVIRSRRRNQLQAYLAKQNIQTLIHYPVPVHLQPAYKQRFTRQTDLKYTERVVQEILSLPLYPELAQKDVKTVIKAIKKFWDLK